MRFLVFIIAAMMLACCGLGTEPAARAKELEGSWKLLAMSKQPVDPREVVESDLVQGSLNFKADNTFDGEIIYPRSHELDLTVNGTYSLENNVVTIINYSNNSSTRSTIAFEKDVLVITPLDPPGFISYLKRVK